MLQKILETTGIESERCAALLGISPRIFGEWTAGQRPIPPSMLPMLSSTLGVSASTLLRPSKQAAEALRPAIWYKFRGENLVDEDRECVLLVRQIGHLLNELEEVTGKRKVGWKALFEDILREVDLQAPPREQGRRAARILRESRGLGHGATGIGEVFRSNLRMAGIMIVETPLAESRIEGFSFYVGAHNFQRPCIVANSHHSTWFRRNAILMHEVAHAIFDALTAGASLDFEGANGDSELSEQRAQAFAQEGLVPPEVLRHLTSARGIQWATLTVQDLATLVADTQVEKKLILSAAVEADLLASDQATHYQDFDITSELRELTDHALSTEEYIKKLGEGAADRLLVGKRTTTIPDRSIRLPVPYVMAVVQAVNDGEISQGKAAELLRTDRNAFTERFANFLSVSVSEE